MRSGAPPPYCNNGGTKSRCRSPRVRCLPCVPLIKFHTFATLAQAAHCAAAKRGRASRCGCETSAAGGMKGTLAVCAIKADAASDSKWLQPRSKITCNCSCLSWHVRAYALICIAHGFIALHCLRALTALSRARRPCAPCYLAPCRHFFRNRRAATHGGRVRIRGAAYGRWAAARATEEAVRMALGLSLGVRNSRQHHVQPYRLHVESGGWPIAVESGGWPIAVAGLALSHVHQARRSPRSRTRHLHRGAPSQASMPTARRAASRAWWSCRPRRWGGSRRSRRR
jgi:hypothetical protein